ncbi:unnamed protein product [Trichogramma brassicae]|uniref:Uncharacterized protein n=1 Tax=Trichogramma brassicae TaxID=86971 RepID=A0A6H5IQ29_9HYME|nr:unnamed protein product [Trichogramma brassicae]
MEGETDPREQLFQNTIREYTICLLLFLILYTLSYILINRLRPGVYRISLWLCATALAISIGATLLLPVSIASNEFLLLYPDSCNVEWLNSSLIQGLWNFIFLLSNLSLFVFLPFAYLFTESEGFLGNKKIKIWRKWRKMETLKICPELYYDGLEILDVDNDSSTSATELTPDDNTSHNQMLNKRLQAIQKRKYELDKQRQTGWVRRTFFYPVSMLALLMFSMTTGLITLQNTLQLLVGIKALPISTSKFTLGISSLSKLGPLGAGIQVILILYLAVTSAVGLYSLPGFEKVRPELHSTPITHLIANCAALVVLSSALPLLSRMIGITNFDLLGDYGRIEWLGSFKLVLIYNVIFALTAIICSVTKFSAAVRNEVWTKLLIFLLF